MLVGWTDVTITSFLIFLLQYKTAVVGKMNGWPYTYMTLARVKGKCPACPLYSSALRCLGH